MKKGFIFMETLIVLIVLLVTVGGMYAMYSKISVDIDNRRYYDNISDLYKTDILRSNINVDSIIGNGSILEINKNNCTSYMNSECAIIMSSLKADKIYINLNDINSAILSLNNSLTNSARSYLKTINKDKSERYIIVNYKYNSKNYYASLRI